MIQETTTYTCCLCDSANIIKNGSNKYGNRQYHCKDCGVYRVLKAKERHSQETRDQVLKLAQGRVSLCGIEHVFNVCRQTVVKLLFVLLALTGMASLWLAILADVGVSLIVTLNSMRPLKYK